MHKAVIINNLLVPWHKNWCYGVQKVWFCTAKVQKFRKKSIDATLQDVALFMHTVSIKAPNISTSPLFVFVRLPPRVVFPSICWCHLQSYSFCSGLPAFDFVQQFLPVSWCWFYLLTSVQIIISICLWTTMISAKDLASFNDDQDVRFMDISFNKMSILT